MSSSTDRIQKQVVLRASRQRVWSALTDSKQFGAWFGVELDGPFVAGQGVSGRIVPTQVDAEVAKAQQSHAGAPFYCQVQRIEPMRLFSFRWHAYAVDPRADPANEPMTLVTFELREVEATIELTITESGFDQVPLERRATAFASNDEGWSAQAVLISKYLARMGDT